MSGFLGGRNGGEAARRRFALWALGLMILVLPLWWFLGADLAAAALRPVVEIVGRLFGLAGAITPTGDGWTVATRLTRGGQPVDYPMASDVVRRMLLSVPLTAALLLAPPRARLGWRGVAICVGVLAAVFVASVIAFVWGELTPMLNPDRVPGGIAPGGPVDQPPLNPLAAQIAVLGRYIAFAVAPLVTAAILWAGLNPEGRRLLLGEVEESPI